MPEAHLPMFEGRSVQGATLKLTGKAEDRVGALRQDEQVFLIVRGRVSKVSHVDGTVHGASLYLREHVIKADRMTIVEPDDGERMLSEATMLADERFGLAGLFSTADGPDGETGEVPEA